MTIFTGSITNADVLMNGIDVAGRIMEIDLGEHGYEEVEHKTLGTIGVLKVPSRVLSAIEATTKYEWLDAALKKQVILPTKTHDLQLHQYVDVSARWFGFGAITPISHPCWLPLYENQAGGQQAW